MSVLKRPSVWWVLLGCALLVLLLRVMLSDEPEALTQPVATLPEAPVSTSSPVELPAPLTGSEGVVRFSESEPEPTAAPRDPAPAEELVGSLRLRIRHAHGPAAARARVALQREPTSAWLTAGRLDEDGAVELGGVPGPVDVVLIGATPQPARWRLQSGVGEHELVLPESGFVSGRVLINGAPPGESFPIRLRSLREPGGVAEGEVGLSEMAVAGRGYRVYGAYTHTDADGRFVFSGLDADLEEVSLAWPILYRLVDAESTPRPLRPGQQGVVLSLRRPALVTGRVLHADGTPAPDASFTAVRDVSSLPGWRDVPSPPNQLQSIGPSMVSSRLVDQALDADARFVIPVGDLLSAQGRALSLEEYEPDLEHLTASLALDLACEHGALELVLPELDLRQDVPLGDLVLQPALLSRLRVVDESGAPLSSARVRVETANSLVPVFQADTEGRVEFSLSSSALGVVTVVAPGFESARFAPSRSQDPDEQVVVLRAATELLVRVQGPWTTEQERAEWTLSLVVVGGAPLFQDNAHAPVQGLEASQGPDTLRSRGGLASFTGYASSFSDGSNTLRASATLEADEARVEALRAHHPMRVMLRVNRSPADWDLESGTYLEGRELWLDPGQTLSIDMDLSALLAGR